MALDPLEQLDLSDLPDYDADQEISGAAASPAAAGGVWHLFVRCSPEQGHKLVGHLKQDLPRKRCAELT
jgi:hypothetical protein